MKKSINELARFTINSTIGILGLFDPAKKRYHLEMNDEDTGQTLGKYGIGNGFYIVLPILGPSTLRDSVGLVGDFFLYPVSYLKPAEYYATYSYQIVNYTSLNLGNYESIKNSAIDPYNSFKNIYLQYRAGKLKE